MRNGRNIAVLVTCFFIMLTGSSLADPIAWTDWTSATATTASGTIPGLTVSFTGNINPAAQTSGAGANFWDPTSTFTSVPEVDNAPPDSDIIRLSGGAATGVQTITFSAPVIDPVIAILSLGQTGVEATYEFDGPFTLLNVGAGPFGSGTLTVLPGDILSGTEGNGVIQFSGVFTSISWTMPIAEFWHGFQVGVTGAQPVPSLSAWGLSIVAICMLITSLGTFVYVGKTFRTNNVIR